MRAPPSYSFTDDQGTVGNVQFRTSNGSNSSRAAPQGYGTTNTVFEIWDVNASKSFFTAFSVKLSAEL